MCDYQGYEFGASFPDSICIDGRLFDADDCDGNGNVYEPSEYIPCPMCHEEKAITYWKNRFECGGEPQGFRKEQPRDPLEGRGKQAYESVERRHD